MRKQDPAAKVVQYFEGAPVTAAQTVLAICQAIVLRRSREASAELEKPKRQGKRANAEPPSLPGLPPIE